MQNIVLDMWDRTLSVFSVGKTFSCTGWRVGYAVGPEELIAPLKCIQVSANTRCFPVKNTV